VSGSGLAYLDGQLLWSKPDGSAGRVGGDCPFVACMPPEALLRSAQVRRLSAEAHLYGAVAEPLTLDDPRRAVVAAARRDRIAERRDDSSNAAELARSRASLYRGSGQIVGRGRVGVGRGPRRRSRSPRRSRAGHSLLASLDGGGGWCTHRSRPGKRPAA
jgi:pyruvate/2-oxoglutarate dehydrogenase complex dihydrolipoamide dehydrogenase (E3) component